MKQTKILAFYKFTNFEDLARLRLSLLEYCHSNNVLGSVLISNEGINGTIAGNDENVDLVLSFFKKLPGCKNLEYKVSFASKVPFLKLRVRLKKEIVTMGKPGVKPSEGVGHYVTSRDWNTLIKQDDVVVIDTRNDYEVAIGTFNGSVNPKTKRFRDFPSWWEKNGKRYKDKRIAMFCTGGIRCEKSTNYLIQNDHKNVFHLKGGILKYLKDVPVEESEWKGECFVFDQRVSVQHGLVEGSYNLCFACRRPISQADKEFPEYEEGVSCHNCLKQHSLKRKEGFRERQRQLNQKALK